jgi:hypothetical protein
MTNEKFLRNCLILLDKEFNIGKQKESFISVSKKN